MQVVVCWLLAGAVPVQAASVRMRARFEPLQAGLTVVELRMSTPPADAGVGTAQMCCAVSGSPCSTDLLVAGIITACPGDPVNRCVDMTIPLSASDTRDFKLCVANAVGGACSNAVRFQVPTPTPTATPTPTVTPTPPRAPTLGLELLGIQ